MKTPSSRLIAFRAIHLHTPADVILMNLDWNERATTPMSRMFQHYERLYTDHRRGYIEEFHPFALVAKANQEDYPTY